MKSFRLDTESIHDAIASWPAILAAVAISAGLAYLGWLDAAWRALLILFATAYFGYLLRGRFADKLRAKYPNAKCLGLVSIGLTSATLGVFVRMLMPSLQGGWTDYVWLTVSFTTILAFVILNRHDPDVFK